MSFTQDLDFLFIYLFTYFVKPCDITKATMQTYFKNVSLICNTHTLRPATLTVIHITDYREMSV